MSFKTEALVARSISIRVEFTDKGVGVRTCFYDIATQYCSQTRTQGRPWLRHLINRIRVPLLSLLPDPSLIGQPGHCWCTEARPPYL